MSNCVVCYRSNIKCFRCENTLLKLKIEELETLISKYHADHVAELSFPAKMRRRLSDMIYRSPNPIPFNYKDKLSTSYFITLTFDPARFGLVPYENLRKEYILQQLLNAHAMGILLNFYGSFEFHANGLIHSHLIGITNDATQLKSYLRGQFTDNHRNKYAVDVGKAKHPQAQQYIEKESTDYFQFIEPIPHVETVVETIREPKVYWRSPYDELINPNPLDYGL